MIKVDEYQGVTRLVMGREIAGRVEYWCAAYLVDGLLIDAGCAHTTLDLLGALEGRRVDTVVNTHYHEDHVGANAALVRALGAELYAPADSIEIIRTGYALPVHRQMVWGEFEASHPRPLGREVLTAHHRFEVIPAPGHSADHVALVERRRGWAFVGDVFIVEEPKTCRSEDDHNQTLASLKRLRDAGARVMFNGLGEIIEDAPAVLERTIAYLERMRDEFQAMRAAGLSPAEIVAQRWGRESRLSDFTGGEFSYENFVRSFFPEQSRPMDQAARQVTDRAQGKTAG